MSIEHLIRNSFEKIKASRTKKEEFVSDHYQRMKNDTLSGALDGIITETEPMVQEIKTYSGDMQTIKGENIGSTQKVNELKEEFIDDVNELEALTNYKYKKNSAKYREMFVDGLTEFNRASFDEIPSLIKRCRNYTEKYEADLGSEIMLKFKEFDLKWEADTTEKKSLRQDGSKLNPDFIALWAQLSVQLQRNSYTILLACPKDPRRLLTYFDFRIVNHRHHQTDDTTSDSYTLSIAPASSKAADFTFAATDNLLIMNNSNQAIYFYAAATADAAQPAQLTEIAAGDELEITAAQLGAPANKFLIFVNKDAAQQAEVEIALI